MLQLPGYYSLLGSRLSGLGCVLDYQQNQLEMVDTTGIQQHDAPPDCPESVLYLETVEALFPGENLFQQFTESRYVPLPVSQLIDVAPFGFAGLDLKRRVERSVGCLDP